MNFNHLQGVYAAAVTPLTQAGSLDPASFPQYLSFLEERGCHGALILGTTGEGPSFSPPERIQLYHSALRVHQDKPGFRLLAGTGTPSLAETQKLTKTAFDMGFAGVVVLPPYYYREATEEGLFIWFRQVMERSVPKGGALLGYHFPKVSGVPLSIDLISRLKDAFPDRFAGIKNSSGDPALTHQLGGRFGDELVVLPGNDRLFSDALGAQAAGCITALANLASPLHRQIWDAFQAGKHVEEAQERLSQTRNLLERFPPAPPLIKFLLSHAHGFPHWSVRAPLLPLSSATKKSVLAEFDSIS